MRLGSETFEEELGVAGDDHQQVIKIVGDAPGEASDGFHLLRLAQLLFESAALGDVFGEEFEDCAFLATLGNRAARDPNCRIVIGTFTLPFGDQPAERSRLAEMIGKIEPLVGVSVEAVDVLADHVPERVLPEQFEEGGIRVEDFSGRVAAADAVGSVGDEGTEIELGPAEVLLGGSQGGVEPADQHREEEEKRQPHDRDAKLIGSVFAHECEVGAYGKRE